MRALTQSDTKPRFSARLLLRRREASPARVTPHTIRPAADTPPRPPALSGPRNPGTTTPVTIVLASAGDLHRVPWLLPDAGYFACEVIVLDDDRNEIDLGTWAFLNEHGIMVRFFASFAQDANVALDAILESASGDLILALDSHRCEDIADVADFLAGDARGAAFAKDTLVLSESQNRSEGHGRREASMAWRYSNANGTPIRDFGVGSFAIRRDAVPTILGVGRPPTGEGSPLGREALASLAIAASLARLTIHEAPVYAYERDTRPIDMEFLDHVGPTPSRLGAPTSTWHRAQSPQPQQEAVKVEVRVAQYQSAEV